MTDQQRLADQAAALLHRSRMAQGLPPTITDPTVLRRVVDVVRPPSTATLAHRSRKVAVR